MMKAFISAKMVKRYGKRSNCRMPKVQDKLFLKHPFQHLAESTIREILGIEDVGRYPTELHRPGPEGRWGGRVMGTGTEAEGVTLKSPRAQ